MKKRIVWFLVAGLSFAPVSAVAQPVINLNASDFATRAEIFFSPQSGSFLQDAVFEVPVFINTKGRSVNAIELHLKFDANKLRVVKPSGGTSIIGLWVGAPSYDNVKGTADFVGTIPQGITTNSGLIVTMTFQAKAPGDAVISVAGTSQILLNDGVGTPLEFESNRANYVILSKPPDGAQIFSVTHPFQDRWYNNDSPSLNWNKDEGVTGFSFTLDNKPTTIPDNTVASTDPVKAYQDLSDGIWYFHLKARKGGVWGPTSHFILRVDTTPPAEFTPTIDYLGAAVITRFLVSFFTTDNLSGIDHYEVGVIDKSAPVSTSPTFIQTESPYQLPMNTEYSRVIVRAFDKAGNIRDASLDIRPVFLPLKLITDNAVIILLTLLLLILTLFAAHYIFHHRIIKRVERGFELLRKQEEREREVLSSNQTHDKPL